MSAAHGSGKCRRRVLLFVAGDEANSVAARANLERLRASESRCELEVEVIDVLERYRDALEHRILVTPCLVVAEAPRVMIAGTLTDLERVRAALRLPERPEGSDG